MTIGGQAGDEPGTVGIVGAGQVGTMLGLALCRSREQGGARSAADVVLFDRDRDVAERSRSRGSADRIAVRLSEVLDADTLILAVPVPEIVRLLDEWGGRMRTGSLVMDTGSAKRVVVEAMRRSVPEGVHAIGGHPLAGTERPGPEGANLGALSGAAFFLTPARDDPEALARGASFAEAVGANPVVLDAETHDRVVALTSHLPHTTAFALAALAGAAGERGEPVAALASTGFGGATRLARSDPKMVAGFLSANADEVRAVIEGLVVRLEILNRSLDDPGRLEALLAAAAAGIGEPI